MSEEKQLKYGIDCMKQKTLGDIVEGLADLVDSGAKHKAIAAYLDVEFLFGAHGHQFDAKTDHFLLKDLRGFIYAAYVEGRKRGSK